MAEIFETTKAPSPGFTGYSAMRSRTATAENQARNRAQEGFASEAPLSYQPELEHAVCACIGDVVQDLKSEYREAIEQIDRGGMTVKEHAFGHGGSMNRISKKLPCLLGSAIKLANVLVLASLLSLQGLASAQDGSQKQLTHRGLKSMIQRARTREDHLKIAAYYHAEAVKLRKEASEHADLASAYANGTRYSPKSGMPNGELEHCKSFANSIEAAAKDAEALAESHQEMANQVKQ